MSKTLEASGMAALAHRLAQSKTKRDQEAARVRQEDAVRAARDAIVRAKQEKEMPEKRRLAEQVFLWVKEFYATEQCRELFQSATVQEHSWTVPLCGHGCIRLSENGLIRLNDQGIIGRWLNLKPRGWACEEDYPTVESLARGCSVDVLQSLASSMSEQGSIYSLLTRQA